MIAMSLSRAYLSLAPVHRRGRLSPRPQDTRKQFLNGAWSEAKRPVRNTAWLELCAAEDRVCRPRQDRSVARRAVDAGPIECERQYGLVLG